MIDPLLRPRDTLPDGSDRVVFAGVECAVEVVDTDPTSAAAQWSAEREIVLSLPGDVTPDALADLLPVFVDHARERADRPAAAVFTIPSRAIDLGRVARAAGFAGALLVAVHDLRRPDVAVDDHRVPVRAATPADAGAVTRLWWEQAEYEARVGSLRVSPEIRAAIEALVPGHLAGETTVLVAEATEPDGATDELAGVVLASSVGDSTWLASQLATDSVSYLDMASTAPAHRGSGVGAALVAELHRRHRSAGIALSALHYSADNPLSVPFWSQRGYRPVLTHFAATVRS